MTETPHGQFMKAEQQYRVEQYGPVEGSTAMWPGRAGSPSPLC